jgi:hypothetical protein
MPDDLLTAATAFVDCLSTLDEVPGRSRPRAWSP